MSMSGQTYIAKTQGTVFTLYAVMRSMGIRLSEEQQKFQKHLERTYPRIVGQHNDDEITNSVEGV